MECHDGLEDAVQDGLVRNQDRVGHSWCIEPWQNVHFDDRGRARVEVVCLSAKFERAEPSCVLGGNFVKPLLAQKIRSNQFGA